MNLFKITALTVLCLFNVGIFGQDQQPHVKQLEYDILTWKVRDKAVNDVKSWALKADVACIVIDAVLVYAFGASRQEKNSSSGLSEYEKFLCNSLDFTATFGKVFGSTWLASKIASKYTASMVSGLEQAKEQIQKNKKIV